MISGDVWPRALPVSQIGAFPKADVDTAARRNYCFTMSTTKKLYTLREAAALHGVGHVAFWRACKAAGAKTQSAGNCRLITAAEAKRAATYLGAGVVRTGKRG